MAAKKRRGPGRPFQKGDDARRNTTKPGPGRAPDEFKAMMRALASREAVMEKIAEILSNPDHPQFMRAFAEAADRGYGKATQPVEHNGSVGLTVAFRDE